MDEKDEDLDSFDPNIPEEGPSAPPPGWLEDIHGYQGLTEGGPEDEEPLYPRPPPITPNLTSTGAPQSPPSESRQYRRMWPGRLC
ncbi:hypothetical protein CRENBAI_008623 [Crenichthys baileyi]|uniref:Uncharacterized protein n=1 Tax=Crenichthys baileyi TaxID=28760 RepID=A0AAV9RYU3_9TELE